MGKNKKPKNNVNPLSYKKPKIYTDPSVYLSRNPSWQFSLSDKKHDKWKFDVDRFDFEIMSKLESFETMTWADIMKASGGRNRGTNNHFIDVSDLSKQARDRLEELKIYDEKIFSLRLKGKLRIFGILTNGVFKIIWRDDNHEVCPMKNK